MRQRWSRQTILDAAVELLTNSGGVEAFSMRRLAGELGTDSSSLYRHFRNRTELLLAVSDQALIRAMAGYERRGSWRDRITEVACRVWDAHMSHPQLAVDFDRYPASGPGTRLVMEEMLQALEDAQVPEDLIPQWYHTLATLAVSLIASGAASRMRTEVELEQGRETFQVITLGADATRFPALAKFGPRVKPVSFDRETFVATVEVLLNSVPARDAGLGSA